MSQGHLWAARSKQGPRGQSYPLMKYLHPSCGSTEVTCSMNQMRSGEIEGARQSVQSPEARGRGQEILQGTQG